jgi:hypothetical protein
MEYVAPDPEYDNALPLAKRTTGRKQAASPPTHAHGKFVLNA